MKKVSSEPLLLDVNVLLALAWPNHQFHRAAVRRLERFSPVWATCALTQLGFVRLSSRPAVVGVQKTPWEAASLLALLVADPQHVYLDSLPSPAAGPFLEGLAGIMGSQQVTDSYLLSLAEHHHAKLLTFDARLASLAQGTGRVEVLAAEQGKEHGVHPPR